jgi:Methyltransferase FkbM domain
MRLKTLLNKVQDRLAFKSWFTEAIRYELLQIRAMLEKTAVMVEKTAIMTKEEYLARALSDARYADPLRLERFGFKVYSQTDEDGIIQEIFRRVGTTKKNFIEIGVESGVENNTAKLLLEGWSGLWIEANEQHVSSIKSRFADVIKSGQLTVRHSFVNAENINELIRPSAIGEIDLISIDIDGNDYYILEALTVVRPRVVVIEYNAKFRPPISIVQKYNPHFVWSGTDYMGASLEALVRLSKARGYSLVGCNFTGSNAFLVLSDLIERQFQAPFSSENHYQPARYFLGQIYPAGHPPDWGPYIEIAERDGDNPGLP